MRDVDELVTVSVLEPSSSAAHVTYRPGRRYPLLFVGNPDVARIGSQVMVAARLLEERMRHGLGERWVERHGS